MSSQQLPTHTATCVALTGVVYLALLVLYRLAAHPLSKYPGPLVARLSGLFGAFHAFRTDLHVTTLRNHEDYGPVVRQGPNKLVFNSVEALRDIYKSDQVTKSRAYLVSQRASGVFNLFNAVDPQLHQHKRKLAGRYLSQRSIDAFEPVMIEQIDIFIRRLAAHVGPVNMTTLTKHLTIDVMGHLLFKYPLNLQTEPTHRHMAYSRASFFFNVAFQVPSIPNLRVSTLQSLWSLFSRKRYVQTLDTLIRSRLSQGQHVKDELRFMSGRTAVSEDDQEWIKEARTEAIWHILAGTDTTSTLVSALCFYVLRNSHCYKRLCQEIRSTFAQDSDIRGGALLANCTYLRACIDETLRMTPPLPGTLWREGLSQPNTEHLIVDGQVIPEGVQVGVNTYAILHNSEYFPEPFVFKPERWLEGAEPGAADRNAFVPFSLGPRGCLGKSMAYLEASIIVAKMLWNFDFEEATGVPANRSWGGSKSQARHPNEFPVQDSFAAVHDGPYLNLHVVGGSSRTV